MVEKFEFFHGNSIIYMNFYGKFIHKFFDLYFLKRLRKLIFYKNWISTRFYSFFRLEKLSNQEKKY
jgi:hypothetical protein